MQESKEALLSEIEICCDFQGEQKRSCKLSGLVAPSCEKNNNVEQETLSNRTERKPSVDSLSNFGSQIWEVPDIEHVNKRVICKLITVGIVCAILMVTEFVGGTLAGSLAILTDAAHLLSDLLGLILSVSSMYLAKRPSSPDLTFGYHRAEVLGVMASIILVWGLTVWLVGEAVQRLIHQDYEIDKNFMLYTSFFGLFCNLLMGCILHTSFGGHHSHSEESAKAPHQRSLKERNALKQSRASLGNNLDINCGIESNLLDIQDKIGGAEPDELKLAGGQANSNATLLLPVKPKHNLSMIGVQDSYNMRAATINIIGDTIQSTGVVIASLIVFFTGYKIADPICTFFFALLVVITTSFVARDCLHVLMEGSPKGFNREEFLERLRIVDGVQEIHDFHVWSLSIGRPSISLHIASTNPSDSLRKATVLCRKYGIYHSTIQIEDRSGKDSAKNIKCNHNIHV